MSGPFVPGRLTSERERQRLSVTALARKVGVTRQTIHNWESGVSVPHPRMVMALAEALDVDAALLLTPKLVDVDMSRVFFTWRERQ